MLALSIISALICFLGGGFYGILPMKEDKLTGQQKTITRTVSIVVFGLVIILILVGEDLWSWIAIGAAIIGFGIGKIPALRKFFAAHWKIFRSRDAKTLSPRKVKKRAQQQNQARNTGRRNK
ncbi:MAG: hypothetical protein LKI93_00305 [Bifidobacteriaceae bacterium]|jgi:Sec-independent protein translocase protein TatA|nr:hypothetical protein [Bifidobacteriaceae bacterium]MCI1914162.1 hypothetical protein [Bifidobacteriaceae bacterium]